MTEVKSARSTADAPRQLDGLELVATLYLALPLAVWIVGWLKLPVAVVLAGALALSVWKVARDVRPSAYPPLPLAAWVVAAALAAGWVALSGMAGGLRMNDDWLVRLPVLRDLTLGAWPVGYGPGEGGGTLTMRFPMAYYLLPALTGKLFGEGYSQPALYVWTVLGVILFFALALSAWRERSPAAAAVLLAVLVMFSGMDIVGWWLKYAAWPAFGQHIEWWTWMFQYSGQTTLLFWAPNHALPAWLAAVLMWRHRQAGLALAPVALLLLCVAAWAPLPAVGLAPLLLACSVRGQLLWKSLRDALHPAVWATVPVVLALGLFFTFGASQKDSALNASISEIQNGALVWILPQLGRFAFIEWGLLALVLWRSDRQHWLFWAAAIVLLLLPTQRFGPGNDIVMRGGIPAMTVMVLAAAAALTAPETVRRWRIALAAMLVVGAVGPMQEVQRAFTDHRTLPDPKLNLVEVHGSPWHYVGNLQPGRMKDLLKPPVPLPPRP